MSLTEAASPDDSKEDLHQLGVKADDGKILAGLIKDFPRALLAIAEVGTYGAKKYTRGGWISVPNGIERYNDAKWRHELNASITQLDQESGLPHKHHAAWNCLAELELILKEAEE